MARRLSLSLLVMIVLAACATVPYTQRHQFNLVSRLDEIQLGEQAYDEVLKSNPPVADEALQRRLRSIGEKIARAADQPDYKWAFNVVQGKDINAFCLPGGKVAFYQSILPVCETDNGIAVVMGHEVAHALAHHGAERMSQGKGAEIIGDILSVGLSKSDPAVQKNVLQVYGAGAQVGIMLPFSRSHESEADHIGLILMAKAGYDPHGAVEFWKRMQKLGGQKPPEWLSTHPSDDRRVQQIEAWLPEAMSYYHPE